MTASLVTFLALIFAFGLVSHRLERTVITGPMVFTAAGLVVAAFMSPEERIDFDLEELLWPAKLALALILFTDATHVRVRGLLGGLSLPGRLLGFAMPLVMAFGTIAGLLVLGELSLWEAAILAAILAPTDAGLGHAIMSSKRVPDGIRQGLNVEAGLNDGLAIPFLILFIALARLDDPEKGSWVVFLLEQIGYGVLIGVVFGALGGWLMHQSQQRGWMTHVFYQLALIALALLSFVVALEVGGNEFIAPFVAGLLVKLEFEDAGEEMESFSEVWGQSLNYFVFFVFGSVAFGQLESISASAWTYGVLSLTVVRLAAVGLSMIGVSLRPASVLFMGWFGPRGLASIVLGLILIKEDAAIVGQTEIERAVVATVLSSIFLHGMTTAIGIDRYASRIGDLPPDAPERVPVVGLEE